MDIQGKSALSFRRQKSLAEQISDTVVQAISLGVFKSEERIVEADIAARLNVSRVPIREALKILETQGILEGEPHRGLRVVKIDDELIDEICGARLAIEMMAVRSLLAKPASLLSIGPALEERIAEMAVTVRMNDLVGVNQADLRFHADICLFSGNRIVWTLWQSVARHVSIVFGREILSETSLTSIVNEHVALKDAILAGDPKAALVALEAHVLRLRKRQRS